MTDLNEAVVRLAAQADARAADLTNREEKVKATAADQAKTRVELDVATRALAERLAVVNQAEADLQKRLTDAAGEFRTLEKATAAAAAARAEYEALIVKIKEIAA